MALLIHKELTHVGDEWGIVLSLLLRSLDIFKVDLSEYVHNVSLRVYTYETYSHILFVSMLIQHYNIRVLLRYYSLHRVGSHFGPTESYFL